MRDKILAQLVAKYAGVSKQALGLIADKLAKKVTDESGIDQAITDFDNAVSITDYAADLQRESDRRVTEAKKEWDKKNPVPKPEPTPDPDPNKPKDETPVWAKSLMDEVALLRKEKTQGSMKQRATELLKDVPATYWNGRALPEKEDDLQAFVDSVNADYTAFKQDLIEKGLMTATPPGGGDDGKKPDQINQKVVDADIKAWADKGKASESKS